MLCVNVKTAEQKRHEISYHTRGMNATRNTNHERLAMSVRSRAARISKAVQAIGCQIEREHTARTGTIYLTVAAPEGECVVVRVADHCDAYGASDYTADDMLGTDKGAIAFVKKWLASQCEKNEATREEVKAFLASRKSNRALRAKLRKLAKQYRAERGEYLLLESGEQWYLAQYCIDKANSKHASELCLQTEIERLIQQMAAA